MDFTSLKDQVSNLTLYDLKAGVRKVQNGELTSIALRTICVNIASGDELYGDGSEGRRVQCGLGDSAE